MRKYLPYTVPVFLLTGRPLFSMARRPSLEPVALRLARALAILVQMARGKRRVDPTPHALAREWQRLMPQPRAQAFPITKVEPDTAYVEIRLECPLRGTGDAEACWRAMAFDRALMQDAGSALVVLESQAVTGGDCCKLAIRPAGAALDDLPVAHPRWLEVSP